MRWLFWGTSLPSSWSAGSPMKVSSLPQHLVSDSLACHVASRVSLDSDKRKGLWARERSWDERGGDSPLGPPEGAPPQTPGLCTSDFHKWLRTHHVISDHWTCAHLPLSWYVACAEISSQEKCCGPPWCLQGSVGTCDHTVGILTWDKPAARCTRGTEYGALLSGIL